MRKRCRLPEDDCATEREMQAARIATLEASVANGQAIYERDAKAAAARIATLEEAMREVNALRYSQLHKAQHILARALAGKGETDAG